MLGREQSASELTIFRGGASTLRGTAKYFGVDAGFAELTQRDYVEGEKGQIQTTNSDEILSTFSCVLG